MTANFRNKCDYRMKNPARPATEIRSTIFLSMIILDYFIIHIWWVKLYTYQMTIWIYTKLQKIVDRGG